MYFYIHIGHLSTVLNDICVENIQDTRVGYIHKNDTLLKCTLYTYQLHTVPDKVTRRPSSTVYKLTAYSRHFISLLRSIHLSPSYSFTYPPRTYCQSSSHQLYLHIYWQYIFLHTVVSLYISLCDVPQVYFVYITILLFSPLISQ